MLGWTGAAAPEGLWDRIADQLEEVAPPPSGRLAAVLSLDEGAARRSRSTWGPTVAWIAATAAAAAVAVLAVSVIDRDRSSTSPMEAAVDAARDDRDSVVTTLVSADGTLGGEAIIDQDGHGYLVLRDLPELAADRTYQLWGVIDGEPISLGVLGNHPEVETFTAEGDLTQLVITNEVAGGVITDGNPDGAYAGPVT